MFSQEHNHQPTVMTEQDVINLGWNVLQQITKASHMFSGLTFVYASDQDFGIWLDVSIHIPNRRIQNKLIQANTDSIV